LQNNLFVVSTETVSEIMGSGREVSKITSLIWQISFNGQRCDLKYTIVFLNDKSFACSWYFKNRKKAAFEIVLFSIQTILDEGHYLSRYYENTHLELFVQKCYKSREKYVLK